MNGDLPIRLGQPSNHPHTAVICENSHQGNCYVIYIGSHNLTEPDICYRYAPKTYVFEPCPDCPMIRAFELAYTEIMRKKHVLSKP